MTSEYECHEFTWHDLVRQYWPNATDEFCQYVLWEHTGFPEFWTGDPVQCCSEQLAEYRRHGEQA